MTPTSLTASLPALDTRFYCSKAHSRKAQEKTHDAVNRSHEDVDQHGCDRRALGIAHAVDLAPKEHVNDNLLGVADENLRLSQAVAGRGEEGRWEVGVRACSSAQARNRL